MPIRIRTQGKKSDPDPEKTRILNTAKKTRLCIPSFLLFCHHSKLPTNYIHRCHMQDLLFRTLPHTGRGTVRRSPCSGSTASAFPTPSSSRSGNSYRSDICSIGKHNCTLTVYAPVNLTAPCIIFSGGQFSLGGGLGP